MYELIFFVVVAQSLTFMIKTTYKYTQYKNLVWNQYTQYDSPRFSHSDRGSSPVKTCVNKRTLLEEK